MPVLPNTPTSGGDLTTVANVEQYASIQSSPTVDANLQVLISAVSNLFYRMTNLPVGLFTNTPYSERYNGNGAGPYQLMLRHSPINSVELVQIDTTVVPLSPDNIAAGYAFDDLCIYLIGFSFRPPISGFSNYNFGPGYQNILVNYHAGYNSVPPELQHAANMTVALWYKQIKNLGEKSVNIQGAVATHDTSDLPPAVKTIFETWKNRVPFMS